MIKHILNGKSKTIVSAAFILSVATLVSRMLGLLRDRLLAGQFGAGEELDIYYTAFRLPDLIFSILIMGTISSTLIPVLAKYFRKNKAIAWELVSNVLNLVFLALIIVASLLAIFAPQIVSIIAPGFNSIKRETTILLTRIMFLSPILLGISSVFSSVLQYFNRFVLYSLAPIAYNLGIILGILVFVPAVGLIGLAWGVVLGAFFHLLIQLPGILYSGFKWKPVVNVFHQGLREISKLIVPRTIGLAGSQINFLIITAIASTLASGSIAIFNFANNLQYVPIGIFGITFAIAAFPRLAKTLAKGNKKLFSKNFSDSFSQILFLVVPVSALLFILRAQIVRILLGTGEFTWRDTRLTAAALGLFSLSIFAQSLIPLLSRAFYAAHNTKTPVLVSLFSIGLNVCFSFFLVWALSSTNIFSEFISKTLNLSGIKNISVLGLPLAFSIANMANFIILLRVFGKKIGLWRLRYILRSFLKTVLATFFMGLTTYNLLYFLNLFFKNNTFIGISLQGILSATGGILVYLLIVFILKSQQLSILQKIFFKHLPKK